MVPVMGGSKERLSLANVSACLTKCGGAGTPSEIWLQQLKEGRLKVLERHFTEVCPN
jgi:hypothetical protein